MGFIGRETQGGATTAAPKCDSTAARMPDGSRSKRSPSFSRVQCASVKPLAMGASPVTDLQASCSARRTLNLACIWSLRNSRSSSAGEWLWERSCGHRNVCGSADSKLAGVSVGSRTELECASVVSVEAIEYGAFCTSSPRSVRGSAVIRSGAIRVNRGLSVRRYVDDGGRIGLIEVRCPGSYLGS